MNKILGLIFLFFFTLSATGQTYTYGYLDPCTGLEKNLEVPSNGVTVSYYGQISTFYPMDFYDGTFESWVQEQSNKYSSISPCSTPIGLGTGLDIAQMSALNLLGIINSLTAASDFKSNKKKDPSNSNSIDLNQSQESGNQISLIKNPDSPADSKNSTEIKSDPDKSGSTGEQKSQNNTSQPSKDDPDSSPEGGQKSGDQKSSTQNSQPANQDQNNQGANSGQKNQEGQTQAGDQKSGSQDQQSQGPGNGDGQGSKTDQGGTNASQGQQTQSQNTNGSNGSGTSQAGQGSQGQQGNQSQNGQSGQGQQDNKAQSGQSGSDQQGGSNTNGSNGSGATQSSQGSQGQQSQSQNSNGSNGSGTTQSRSDQQGQTTNTQNQQDGSTTNGQGSNGNSQLKTGDSPNGSTGGENGQTTIDPKNPDSENKGTDLLGGSMSAMKAIPDKNGSGKPMIIGSSDFVGFNFRNSDVRTGTKSTAGYTSVKWDGSATSGILLDYTSAIRGPNLTGFHARLHEKRIDVASVTLTNGFSGRGQAYGTLAIGQMFSLGKEGKFKTVWMVTGSAGQIYKEKFLGTAAIVGNMYDLKIGERIDMKLMNLFVYAPYVSYYNDIVLKSPYVILPIVGTNLKISKNFKFNINIGGAYAIKENVMNYTVTFGTRFLLQ